MEKMPFEKVSRRDRLRPELAFVAIVDTGHDKPEPDEDWHSKALCLEMDGDIFFPERGGSAEAARKICAKCDVKEPCLESQLALSSSEDGGGIWAGTTVKERQKMRKKRKEASGDL